MRLKIYTSLVVTFLLGVFSSLFSSFIFAQPEKITNTPATLKDLEKVFTNVITVVALIGGFLALIALIIGGFKYMTARGDPKAIAGAQSTITWAFIGLALIIIAWLILKFIEEFTGIPVTIFQIKI